MDLASVNRERVLGKLYSRCHDMELAKDVFQDTCIRLLEAEERGLYEERSSLEGYFSVVAFNILKDKERYNNRRKTFSLQEKFNIFGTIKDSCLDPEAAMEKKEIYSWIQKYILNATGLNKRILIDRYICGLKFADIAEYRKIRIGTALKHALMARAEIKKEYEKLDMNFR